MTVSTSAFVFLLFVLEIFGTQQQSSLQCSQWQTYQPAYQSLGEVTNSLSNVNAGALSPDGRYFYTLTGSLVSRTGGFISGGGPPSPSAIAIYSRNIVSGGLSFVKIYANGDVTPNGLTISGLDGPRTILVLDNQVYVGSLFSESIVTFARNSLTGDLLFKNKIEGHFTLNNTSQHRFGSPMDMAITTSQSFVYLISDSASYGIAVFSRDASTGDLTYAVTTNLTTTSPFLTSPRSVTISPDDQYLYLSSSPDAIVLYNILNTGHLTYISSIRDGFDQGGTTYSQVIVEPYDIAVSPDGKHLYTIGYDSKSVVVFARDQGSGAISLLQSIDMSTTFNSGSVTMADLEAPISLSLNTNGDVLQVVTGKRYSVLSFERSSSSGLLNYRATHKKDTCTPSQVVNSDNDLHFYIICSNGRVLIEGTGTCSPAYVTSPLSVDRKHFEGNVFSEKAELIRRSRIRNMYNKSCDSLARTVPIRGNRGREYILLDKKNCRHTWTPDMPKRH